MFEILQALMALKVACEAADTELVWNNIDGEGGLHVTARIPLTEEQFQFIEDMRQLVGVA